MTTETDDFCFICLECNEYLMTGNCKCKLFYHEECLLKLVNCNQCRKCKVCQTNIYGISYRTFYKVKPLTMVLVAVWMLYASVVLMLSLAILTSAEDERKWLIPYSAGFTLMITMTSVTVHFLIHKKYDGRFVG